MKYGAVAGSDKRVSRLVCGCDRLPLQGPTHLDTAFARGINSFDVARAYGPAEAILGEWMRRRGVRDEVFVITKGRLLRERSLAERHLARDIDLSLDALKTDYVDLYLVHYDDSEIPTASLVEVMGELRKAKKAHAVGVSNFSLPRVQDIQRVARLSGSLGLSAVSVQLSLPVPSFPMWPGSVSISGNEGFRARDWYCRETLPVFAYSCLARGFFADSFRSADAGPSVGGSVQGMHDDVSWLRALLDSPDNRERYRRASILAQRMNVTPAQIAMAYVFHGRLDVFAVSGWNGTTKCQQNVDALDLILTDQQVSWLNLECDDISP